MKARLSVGVCVSTLALLAACSSDPGAPGNMPPPDLGGGASMENETPSPQAPEGEVVDPAGAGDSSGEGTPDVVVGMLEPSPGGGGAPAEMTPPVQMPEEMTPMEPAPPAEPPVIEAFTNFPPGATPEEIGKRVAENFVSRSLRFEDNPPSFHYAEALSWYGSLAVAGLLEDQGLSDRLIAEFNPYLGPNAQTLIPSDDHVDERVFGVLPLEIFIQNQDQRTLDLGRNLADLQWNNPTADGITREARYWIDDMYMITALQVQAFRATGNSVYIDRAALTMAEYLERLQQPNGLFFHTLESPVHWGRGNGWVAAGMTELMTVLPPEHPQYAAVYAGYTAMMAAVLNYQTDNGTWRQIIDDEGAFPPNEQVWPNGRLSWPETSVTAMFTYAIVTGVKNGWLPEETYGDAARAAWLGAVSYLDGNANLTEVCVGTGDGFNNAGPDLQAQRGYYLARPRNVGDLHGQAPILWTAATLLR